ncbi:MAG: hypothetical protein JXR83_11520 [Deltaproteobacteria bacterium]|nr:hypothetical protein [Deltaproteobacteria bacterium]
MQTDAATILYFSEPGPQNTGATLEAALKRARQLGIDDVVVATDSGKTARQVLEHFGPDFHVVAVTNPRGVRLPVARLHDYLPRFREHKQQLLAQGVTQVPASLSDDVVAELKQAGAVVERLDWQRLAQFTRSGLNDLDRVGVASRVALAVAVWAYLAGALAADREAVALAGTGFGGGGADTALVVRTAAAWRDWRVLETVARPRVSPPSE